MLIAESNAHEALSALIATGGIVGTLGAFVTAVGVCACKAAAEDDD